MSTPNSKLLKALSALRAEFSDASAHWESMAAAQWAAKAHRAAYEARSETFKYAEARIHMLINEHTEVAK